MDTYHVGDIWKCKNTITDPETEAVVDPTTVTCTITKPSGTTESASVTKTATGVYRISVSLTEVGPWHAAWSSTGTYQAAQPDSIRVLED